MAYLFTSESVRTPDKIADQISDVNRQFLGI
jgi:S-adenosylmethionine synthetase